MKQLVWYDQLQLAAMLLMAASMPISFHCGLWAGTALLATTVVKIAAQRHLGNPALTKPMAVALGAVILYWLINLASLMRGGDLQEGWQAVLRKGVLVNFAACFLLSDTRYLRERHFRWLFYALWASVCGVFLYYAGIATGKLIGGAAADKILGVDFDPRHHAYTALYADTALAFVYVELQSQWDRLRRGLRRVLAASVALLVLYVLIVNSRAGVLVMWLVAAIGVLHLSLFEHRWKQGLLVALLFAGYTLGASQLLPGHTDRIADTLEKVSGSDTDEAETDARIDINRSALALALEQPWTGYGVGRYRALLVDQYEEDDFDSGADNAFNAHNQYTETVLAVGLVGLLPLLVYLLLPLGWAWKKRRHLLPVLLLTAIVCGNLLFESMLERQMGLLFIGFFLTIIILLADREELPS